MQPKRYRHTRSRNAVRRKSIPAIQDACSTLETLYSGFSSSTCSGAFISWSENDLTEGIFMTAAHCLMRSTGDTVEKAKQVFLRNPITKEWQSFGPDSIYYDGVADVGIVRTKISMTETPNLPLQISAAIVSAGDTSILCGNPGGFDTVSISEGNVRDPHYTENSGTHIVDGLFLTNSGIGGNSGSPVCNTNGSIIGIFTYGSRFYETFGGGANSAVLQKTLPVLLEFPASSRNVVKKFLGLQWRIPLPSTLKDLYQKESFPDQGVLIDFIEGRYSPFRNVLQINDVLLSASSENEGTVLFGTSTEQRTPGVMIYWYDTERVNLTVLRNGVVQEIPNILFTTTYKDVPEILDIPLDGGLSSERPPSEESNSAPPTKPIQLSSNLGAK